MLVTAPADFRVPGLLGMLKRDGSLCYVAASQIKCNSGHLYADRARSIRGDTRGSVVNVHRMLDFAGRHQVWPLVEVVPVAQINTALDRVKTNTMRYRMVVAMV